MSERMVRIQMAQLRASELVLQSKKHEAAGDVEALRTINDELEVIVASLTEIRREQLLEQLPRPKQPRRRWWRRRDRGERP